jgi:uncharacterized protein YutE (UPF0331/DUF86 family)
MVNRELIQSLLLQLEERLTLLQQNQMESFADLQRNPIMQNAVLHLLQTAIEICLDTANHCIADEGWRAPTSNRDTFQILFEQRVLSETLLKQCQHMAGFRNLVVHMYEKIDLADVYAILTKHLNDFHQFADAIQQFLETAHES